MMGCILTKDFGVIASDSAMYDTEKESIRFDCPKMTMLNFKYLTTFIGTNLYFSGLDITKFKEPINKLAMYLSDHFRRVKKDVEGAIIGDEKANFCFYVLGKHGNYPCLAEFNSFSDFKPKYTWSKNGVKISTIFYGDDSDKNEIFKQSSGFMSKLVKKYELMNPGIAGEILTRGIYHKADLEEKIGDKKKYAGGVVNAGVVESGGRIYSLSGMEVLQNG